MKKYLLVLAIMLLVATGCGKSGKTLSCEKKESDGTIEKVVAEFDKDNNATAVTMTMTMPFEEGVTKEEAEQTAGFVCAMVSFEGATCDTKVKDNALEVIFKFDLSKLSDETKEEMGYSKESATYDAMKKSMETAGYTCK